MSIMECLFIVSLTMNVIPSLSYMSQPSNAVDVYMLILFTGSAVLLIGKPASFSLFSSLSAHTILAISGVASSMSRIAFAPSTLLRKMCRLYGESCFNVSLHIPVMYFNGLPSILWLLTFTGSMCGHSILYSGMSISSSSQLSSTNGIAISVGIFCTVASVVAPHPVVPLLNMQLDGISSIQSVRYIAPSGAVILWSCELVVF